VAAERDASASNRVIIAGAGPVGLALALGLAHHGVPYATGQLWQDWGASGSTAALIRPDGHIGWSARRPTPAALRAGVRKAVGAR
jgi:hypothetical protein